MVSWVATVQPPYTLTAINLNGSDSDPVVQSRIQERTYMLRIEADPTSCDTYSFEVTGIHGHTVIRSGFVHGNIPSPPDVSVREGSFHHSIAKSHRDTTKATVNVTFDVRTYMNHYTIECPLKPRIPNYPNVSTF